MIATNLTKYNGKWYRAGETLPDTVVEETPVIEEPKEEKKYKKSEITTMNVKNLRKVAEEIGIETPDNYVGSELKTMIIEKLGL